MRFEPVPLSEAEGKILGHNIAGENGQRLLRKGKRLTDTDLERLRELGRQSVYVAQLEGTDIDENTAARQVAEAVSGPGLHIQGAASGRANLLAEQQWIGRIDVERLIQINECDGITLATLLNHTPVHARQIVATVKIIPYAVPESAVRVAEAVGGKGKPIVRVDALPTQSVGMILSGSTSVHQKLVKDFSPLRERIEKLGSTVTRTDFVALDDESDEVSLSEMLRQQVSAGIRMILLAGDHLTRRDIIQLGHGGLLQDVRERGMPREVKEADSDQNTELESTTVMSTSE